MEEGSCRRSLPREPFPRRSWTHPSSSLVLAVKRTDIKHDINVIHCIAGPTGSSFTLLQFRRMLGKPLHALVLQMPTPSDSTDNLPLQLESRTTERPAHTTCPPEDDRPTQWRVEVLDRLGQTAVRGEINDGPPSQQQESQRAIADSPGPMDIRYDPESSKTSEPIHLMEPTEPSPPSPGASPSGSHMEDKDAELIQQPPPTSSALDLQYSARYGIDSTRVWLHQRAGD